MESAINKRVFGFSVILILIISCISLAGRAQAIKSHSKGKIKSHTAEITSFFLEKPQKDSRYETGPLHILYDDGNEIVKNLPPLQASTDKETVFNDVGFSYVQLAQDHQTLGWVVDVENCCTSYPIPLRVVIFRHRRVLQTFVPGQMVWNWMFIEGGKRVAVVSGPPHGPEIGTYCLYDVQTGKLISEEIGDETTQSLKPDAPDWARLLEERLHKR